MTFTTGKWNRRPQSPSTPPTWWSRPEGVGLHVGLGPSTGTRSRSPTSLSPPIDPPRPLPTSGPLSSLARPPQPKTPLGAPGGPPSPPLVSSLAPPTRAPLGRSEVRGPEDGVQGVEGVHPGVTSRLRWGSSPLTFPPDPRTTGPKAPGTPGWESFPPPPPPSSPHTGTETGQSS